LKLNKLILNQSYYHAGLQAEICFLSNYKEPWYKRIYYAFRYIFNREGYCISNSVCIREENIEQLAEIVEIFREKRKELEK
jgi:hypothetical protein